MRLSENHKETAQGPRLGRGALLLVNEKWSSYLGKEYGISGRAVAIELLLLGKKMAIVCGYMPTDPTGAGQEETAQILEILGTWIRKFQEKDLDITLMGDLNSASEKLDREGTDPGSEGIHSRQLLEKP